MCPAVLLLTVQHMLLPVSLVCQQFVWTTLPPVTQQHCSSKGCAWDAGSSAAAQIQAQLQQQLQEAREQLQAEAARSAGLQQQVVQLQNGGLKASAHSNGDASELRTLSQQVWQLRAQLDAAQQVRKADAKQQRIQQARRSKILQTKHHAVLSQPAATASCRPAKRVQIAGDALAQRMHNLQAAALSSSPTVHSRARRGATTSLCSRHQASLQAGQGCPGGAQPVGGCSLPAG